ncbi:molybdopterin oxidoreductase family protein [Nibricoccus sp. IMCC34717]|uniref:molybdopterin oxidoreductase family protein n=1 Tax=Nibricoccus sp. IMCC34717 TaxID=3034021 RepID=UPI00384C988C
MTTELSLSRAPGHAGLLPARLQPATKVKTVCGYCSTGCSLEAHLNDDEAINLSPDPAYPVNQGMACPKGWEALTPLAAPDRCTTPLLRQPNGSFKAISWDEALTVFVSRFKGVQARHGREALSFLSTGQIVTEEMALLGVLAKFGMGMVDVDSNTRQCMATAHVAYKQAFGYDAPPFTYRDFEESDVLVFVGANPAIAHPILWQRVMQNQRNPEIVVIDPRRTETAAVATLHLQLRPKSDLTLLYGIAAELVRRDAIDRDFIRDHCSGFEAFAEFVKAYSLETAASEADVPLAALERLVSLIASGRRVSFWWTMGVNQGHQSTRTAQALINLALMTGNIGKPGTGANSITGQCNAMGSRLYGNATSLIGGYNFADAEDRTHVASILGIDPSVIPTRASRAYDQILDGIEAGFIRGLWVIATDPAHSWIDQKRVGRLRDHLDFLVVQDMYADTETAKLADLILPAAGWGEKDGFFINSERRLGLTRKVRRAPGVALSDFSIFRAIGRTWGCGEWFERWSSPEAAFRILQELSRGQPSDISGIDGYRDLARSGGLQWPFPEGARPQESERRLFADGRFFTDDSRARFLFDPPTPPPETADAHYPFLLNTGRGSSAQWHTGSRTNRSDVLRKLAPTELFVELHPLDAARLQIADKSVVLIRSRRGSIRAVAHLTATVREGEVFLPMHWPIVNQLTFPAFDPHSRQPSFKCCAVRLESFSA